MSGAARRAVQMVSPSVEAAKKLPPTIKKQSVPNALMKGGAKPIELEYAGFPSWLEQQPDRVSSEDVIRHLSEQGPMGRLQRLDAQGPSPEGYDDYIDRSSDEPLDEDDESYKVLKAQKRYDELSDDAKKFTVAPDHMGGVSAYSVYSDQQSRLPTNPSQPVNSWTAWPHTKYEVNTEADAHNWPADAYREIYWMDPATINRNRENARSMVFNPLADPLPVNAHDTDVWARYHLNNDPRLGEVIDVTNIQSDIGQRVAKAEGVRDMPEKQAILLDGYNERLDNIEHAQEQLTRDIMSFLTQPENKRALGRSIDAANAASPFAFTPLSSMSITVPRLSMDMVPSDAKREILRHWQSGYLTGDFPDPSPLQSLLDEYGANRNTAKYVMRNRDRYASMLGRSGLGGSRSGYMSGVQPSNLFRDNNWLQIPLRHLVAQSAQMGGAPIRLPHATNVRAVEKMPRQAAAQFYNRNMVRQLQSILRPLGGSSVEVVKPTGIKTFDSRFDDGGTYRSVRVGPDGQRAGPMVIPSQKAVEYIQKYGMPFMSLLLAPAAGAAANNQQQEVR